MITLPTWRDWIFALKTFGAAILALYLAMWFDLPRPYWALTTVYITSQVLAGATRSKALYRVMGTFLGAAIGIVLVPNLANSPALLSVAVAAWVGFCLYVSLLDRTPKSYVMMLAGYSLAIIAFPTVDAPETIFDTAVARVEEISIGILCASVVSMVVLPESALPVISARLDAWIRSARAWVVDIFDGNGLQFDTKIDRLRLASEAIAFDVLSTALRYEVAAIEGAGRAMTSLRQHMLMFLPIASAMSDRISVLKDAGALNGSVRTLLSDAAWWLRADITEPALAEQLRDRSRALDPKLGPKSSWNDLIEASLLVRFRDFIDLRQDTRQLQHLLRDGQPLTGPPKFNFTARAQSIRHRDHGMALLSGVGAFLSILVACAMWIGTGWPDGAAAPLIAAVACSFFATFDDPAPYIVAFANAAIIGAVGAGIYLFAVLPNATVFEMLVLALAPWLIACGLFMAQPATAPFALGVAVNGGTMLAIQNGAVGEFTPFANSAIAIMVGIWTAAIVVRLVRSVGAAWSANRLRRLNCESLAFSATRGGANDSLELAALMLDRVGLIAPRLASLNLNDAQWIVDLIAEVRSGINIVELRRVRNALPAPAQKAVSAVLLAVANHLRSNSQPDDPALRLIDKAMCVLLAEEQSDAVREALLGLVGLRRGLFPHAVGFAYVSPLSVSQQASE